MNILAVCNTPLQIINFIKIVFEFHIGDSIDIIISDHIHNSEHLVSNAKKTRIFNEVYYVKSFDYSRKTGKYSNYSSRELFNNEIIRINGLNGIKIYDMLYISNVDLFADRLYEKCLKVNKKIQLSVYEDGYSTYSALGEEIQNACEYENRNKVKKMLRNIYGVRRTPEKYDCIYLTYPERLEWKPNAKIVNTKRISRDNKELIHILNTIFDYEASKDSFDKKYIYFEECYLKEGMPSLEPLFVDIIAEIVGKDNLIVKRHPRVDRDRYSDKGIETNLNTSIPWELICLNEDNISEKVLITISSGSVSMPIDLCGIEVHSIVLKNMIDFGSKYYQDKYYKWLDKNVYRNNSDRIFLPSSIDELKKKLNGEI